MIILNQAHTHTEVALAIDEALGRGLILRRQVEHATVSTRARQRINRALKGVPVCQLHCALVSVLSRSAIT
jgi:hypothetical protein